MSDLVLYFTIALAAMIVGRDVKRYFDISHLQVENFEAFKGEEETTFQSSDETRMSSLMALVVTFGIAMLWLNDETPLRLVRIVAIILIAKGTGLLAQVPHIYRLHYNAQRAIYMGQVFEIDQIAKVKLSNSVLRPGKIVFRDGTELSVFNRGIKSLAQRFELNKQ